MSSEEIILDNTATAAIETELFDGNCCPFLFEQHGACANTTREGLREINRVQACPSSSHDFLKSHVLSSDGTCVLTASETSNYMLLWEIPQETVVGHSYYKNNNINNISINHGSNSKDEIDAQSPAGIGPVPQPINMMAAFNIGAKNKS